MKKRISILGIFTLACMILLTGCVTDLGLKGQTNVATDVGEITFRLDTNGAAEDQLKIFTKGDGAVVTYNPEKPFILAVDADNPQKPGTIVITDLNDVEISEIYDVKENVAGVDVKIKLPMLANATTYYPQFQQGTFQYQSDICELTDIPLTHSDTDFNSGLWQFTTAGQKLLSDSDGNANGNTPMSVTAKAIQAPTYTVTIPEKVAFNSLERTKEDHFVTASCKVSASGVSNLFANDQRLIVSVASQNSYNLSDEAATPNEIAYKLYTAYTETQKDEINGGQIMSIAGAANGDTNLSKTIDGKAVLNTKDIAKAGTYTDILTFTVSLQEGNG